MQAWEDFLKEQDSILGKKTVDKWLRSLQILHFDACNLYLEAKDSFQALWFEEHIRPKIKIRFRNNNHTLIKIHLKVASPYQKKTTLSNDLKKDKKKPVQYFSLAFDALDPYCRLENFIHSKSNLLAYKLLKELKETLSSPLTPPQFNPIYLYGDSGCGKTHLLMSIAHALKEKGLQIIYTRAETFTEHVVCAIRTGQMRHFRQAYRNSDVLLIDNIQILSRKNATQEELFHTFNTLHNIGKQIILASNCSPSELQAIEARLVSRFEWGLTIPLHPQEKETLRSILTKKSELQKYPLKKEVLDFLIDSFGTNSKILIRALEALILRTHLNPGLQQQGLDLPAIKILLADLLEEEKQSLMTPDKIIQTVADFYGIRSEDILSKSQSRECATPRQIAMHLCRQKLKLPFMKIGNIFSRDHSTVMTSIKQIQRIIDNQEGELSQSIRLIQKRLKNRSSNPSCV